MPYSPLSRPALAGEQHYKHGLFSKRLIVGASGEAAAPRSPKGHQRSLRDVAAELAKLGFVNQRGAEFSASSVQSDGRVIRPRVQRAASCAIRAGQDRWRRAAELRAQEGEPRRKREGLAPPGYRAKVGKSPFTRWLERYAKFLERACERRPKVCWLLPGRNRRATHE